MTVGRRRGRRPRHAGDGLAASVLGGRARHARHPACRLGRRPSSWSGDAKNLERALALALEVAETGLPFVVCLNMMDEARARGFAIDAERLAARLSARRGRDGRRAARGDRPARRRDRAMRGRRPSASPIPIRSSGRSTTIEPLMPAAPFCPRALALAALSGDQTLTPWLRAHLADDALARLEEVTQRLRRFYRDDIGVRRPGRPPARGRGDRARGPDTPGAGRLVDPAAAALARRAPRPIPSWGSRCCSRRSTSPISSSASSARRRSSTCWRTGSSERSSARPRPGLADAIVPWPLVRDFFVGPYGLVTMALAYSLALVLPIVGTFFIAFGVLEDSGYLPRLAVMVNRVFKSMGLNGKAVLPMVLGLGCDTMATLTTRILETPKERLIVILLLALGVPCSAQLTVILAMLGGLSRARPGDLGLRGPRGALRRGQARGARAAGPEQRLRPRAAAPARAPAGQPPRQDARPHRVVPAGGRSALRPRHADPLRGRPAPPARLDRAGRAAGRHRRARPAAPRRRRRSWSASCGATSARPASSTWPATAGIDPIQSLVAMVTITLFIPCIANFFMIVKERGWKTAVAIAAFVFPVRRGRRRRPQPGAARRSAASPMKPEETPFTPLPAHPAPTRRRAPSSAASAGTGSRTAGSCAARCPMQTGCDARPVPQLRVPVSAVLADRRFPAPDVSGAHGGTP